MNTLERIFIFFKWKKNLKILFRPRHWDPGALDQFYLIKKLIKIIFIISFYNLKIQHLKLVKDPPDLGPEWSPVQFEDDKNMFEDDEKMFEDEKVQILKH